MENFNIIEEKENPLFKRKEIKFEISAEVTPSHAEARKFISEKFSVPEENIRIKRLLGKFGSRKFIISANIYGSEQDKLDTEGQSKKDKIVQPEQPAPTETPIPETPVSESKESDNNTQESIESKPEEAE